MSSVGEHGDEVLRAAGYADTEIHTCVQRVLLLDAQQGKVKRLDHLATVR